MNWQEILQGLLVLIFIALIFFLAWYIPQLIARKGTFSARGRDIAVLEKIPVSKDSYIMLLKTFDKLLVVGVTPGGMTTLRELDGNQALSDVQVPAGQGFAEIFRSALANAVPEGKVREVFDRLRNMGKGGGSHGEG